MPTLQPRQQRHGLPGRLLGVHVVEDQEPARVRLQPRTAAANRGSSSLTSWTSFRSSTSGPTNSARVRRRLAGVSASTNSNAV